MLSQGFPLIYSKNTGIDGLFKEGEVGYCVNPNNVIDVANTIKKIYNNQIALADNTLKHIDSFSTQAIVEKLYKLYN